MVQCAFASLSIVGRVMVSVLPWTALVLLRAGGAGAVYLAAGALRGQPLLPPRGARARMALLGALGIFINQCCFLAGLQRTTAINATVLVATIPLFTLLFSVLLGKEPLRARFVVGLVMASIGSLVVVGPERADLSRSHLVGDALVVLNSAAYGLYLCLARDSIVKHGASNVIRWVFLAGTLYALPLGAGPLLGSLPSWNSHTALGALYVVLIPTTFAYAANAWCLGRAPASLVSLFIYLQPALAAALALTIGPWLARWMGAPAPHEGLALRTVIGGVGILAGVYVATRKPATAATER